MSRYFNIQSAIISNCFMLRCSNQIGFGLFTTLLPFSTGIFFVLPCIESYQKVDLRTITLSVPPQEVGRVKSIIITLASFRKKIYKQTNIQTYNV